jgi:flagellar biosynthesis protein FlhG
MIVNQVQSSKEGQEIFTNMERVLSQFLDVHPEYLGAIPRDNAVVRAIRSQKPVWETEPESRAGRSLRRVYDNLVNSFEASRAR